MINSFLKPAFADIKKLFLDTVFPVNCLVCDREGSFLCAACADKLSPVPHQYCIICQKPSPFGLTHPACKSPQAPDRFISFLDYRDEKVSQILIEGKYKFLPAVYIELGKLLAKKLSTFYSLLSTGYLLIPLPLHPSRKRWRGFNQAEIICDALSLELNLPIVHALKRAKSTKTQKDLKREERLKNVSGVFEIDPNFKSFNFKSLNFILVDDVSTTGSTLLEACKVLKRNGAAEVICLTVAKD